MASRMAPRFRLSQPPPRTASALLGQDQLAFVFCVASLALSGCQYVSGAAELKVEQAGGTNAAGTNAGTSAQGGGAGAPQSMRGGGPGTAGPWDCVGEPLRDPGLGDYMTSGTVSDLNSRTPVLNASVSACLSSDQNCSAPLATVVASDGSFSMTVTLAFQGYFRIEPPAPFIPAIVQLTTPISLAAGRPDIVLFQQSTLDSLARILGTTIDVDAGHAFFSVTDCNGEPGRNVSVTVSSANAGTYAAYYLADNSIPTTDRQYTGQQGGGGFVNLGPGLATFQVVNADTNTRLATVVAPIRAGVTTFFQVQPH
jgi:hypothetical protein